MHTITKRIKLVINLTLLQASTKLADLQTVIRVWPNIYPIAVSTARLLILLPDKYPVLLGKKYDLGCLIWYKSVKISFKVDNCDGTVTSLTVLAST